MIRSTENGAVLLSSVGRRSQLVECFREALRELDLRWRVIGIDVAPRQAPAAHLVDKCYTVPQCDDPAFCDEVLAIARDEHVRLIIPTIDPELPVYATNRERLEQNGIAVAISDPATVKIACDKEETHRWLVDNGFPTVRQGSPEDVLANEADWELPLIVKPRFGSASVGVCVVKSCVVLKALKESGDGLIVQERARGMEHTINIFVEEGRCLCAVPHRRIETRGGEVSKGVTSKNRELIKLGTRIAERLPGARGALNVQCFVDSEGNTKVIELNARFGGGFPLANRAGAKFPRWMLESVLGLPSTATSEWQDNLLMLRYDSAVFIQGFGENQ